MQVWIDDTELDTVESLELAFELARKHSQAANRLIIDIQGDGRPIDDALLDEPPTDTAGISELRLTTTDPSAFLTETIASAKDALELTGEDQQAAADQIHSGELEGAVESLKSVLEGWHAVRDVVGQSAALAEIDVDSLVFAGMTGAVCIENLSKALAEVRDSLSKQDWASLGDAIEYDLAEQISSWNALLDTMIQTIGSSVARD